MKVMVQLTPVTCRGACRSEPAGKTCLRRCRLCLSLQCRGGAAGLGQGLLALCLHVSPPQLPPREQDGSVGVDVHRAGHRGPHL